MIDYEEKEKDRITQTFYDLMEKYDWGGMAEKTIVRIRFKGKFWMLEPDVQLKEKAHQEYGS